VLQPSFPGQANPYGFETAPIAKRTLMKYLWQAAMNRPRIIPRPSASESAREDHAAGVPGLDADSLSRLDGVDGQTDALRLHLLRLPAHHPRIGKHSFLRAKVRDPDEVHHDWTEKSLNIFPERPSGFFSPVLLKCFVGASSSTRSRQGYSDVSGRSDLWRWRFLGHLLRSVVSGVLAAEGGRDARRRTDQGPAGLKAVVLGAEPVSDSMVRCMQELAGDLGAHRGCAFLESYGSTELKWGLYRMPAGQRDAPESEVLLLGTAGSGEQGAGGRGQAGVLTFSHIGLARDRADEVLYGRPGEGGMHWERCHIVGTRFATIKGPICRADKDFTKIKARWWIFRSCGTRCGTRGVRNFQIPHRDGRGGRGLCSGRYDGARSGPSGHRADQIEALIRRR